MSAVPRSHPPLLRWVLLLVILILPVVLLPAAGPAQPAPPPEKRVALVIGTGAYQAAPPLANKTARIVWALLVKGGPYRARAVAA